MNKKYAIDQDRLVKAALLLSEILDAGYGDQMMCEFWARFHEDDDCRFQDQADPGEEWLISDRAKRLSLLTSAPYWQCEVAVREAMGKLPVRAMGLQLLDEFSQRARKRLAMRRRAECQR